MPNRSTLTPTHLRCQGLVSPRGVDYRQPLISWQLAGSGTARAQTAYQILVATSTSKLAPGTADLWDTGKVDGSLSAQVRYAGKPLESRTICHWTVRVWDETGAAGEFALPSHWEMGLLDETDWEAQWITSASYPEVMPGSKVAPSPIFRKEARIDSPVRHARAYISGLGFFELEVNGRKVGDHVLDPAFTRYDLRTLYVVHDITDHLVLGQNAFGVVLGTGYYNCHTKEVWDFEQAAWRDRPKVIAQIEITHADGTVHTIRTDRSWSTSTGPIVFDGIRNGEFYDARLEKPGWSLPGYDASTWSPAQIAASPGGELISQLLPVKVTQTLAALSVTELADGSSMVDFGQNIAGWAQLAASAPAGTEVTLRYGERLNDDGTLNVESIKTFIKSGEFQTDKYTFKGDGVETWEPRFTFHGFRYVHVTGFPAKLLAENLRARVVHSAFEPAGSFSCSNELLTTMFTAMKWTYTGNFVGIPMDCPQREKNGWTGDTQLATETGLLMFDSAPAYRQWLDDISAAMRPSGQLPGIVPTGGWGYNWGSGPAWDSALTHIPWYIHVLTGDIDVLQRHYEKMKRYVHYMGRMATDDILSFGLGDWLSPIPRDSPNSSPVPLTSTAYYFANAQIVSRIAALTGRDDESAHYAALAERIKAAFNREFYDPATGYYKGRSQTPQAFALYYGLVPDGEEQRVADGLAKIVVEDNCRPTFGIVGSKYVPSALAKIGRSDLVYKMAVGTEFPSWAAWFDSGATTFYEDWKGEGSLNHVALGIICEWMMKWLAGIKADHTQPGFKHSVIQPVFINDLEWVKGEHKTPYGLIRSEWHHEDGGGVAMTIEIPVNTTATLRLPSGSKPVVNGVAVAAKTETLLSGEVDVVELGSGLYEVRV
ncbi:MAG TPA: family 78 glycoside hydrolase catalytic domain [Capsulimonadaceae bacterium]|jgi:alpha-L-rhamnosidase